MPRTYKYKVCTQCGKSESNQWARHWKRNHPTMQIKELSPGEVPQAPYDENWMYLIKPFELSEKFKSAAKIQEVPPTTVPAHDSQLSPQYIEIDVESDDDPNEENAQQDGGDFSCLPTQILFTKAQEILRVIQERLIAKHASMRNQLSDAVRAPETTKENYMRQLYKSHNDSHLSMSRVMTDQFPQSGPGYSFQYTKNDIITDECQATIDYLFNEQKRAQSNIAELTTFVDNLQSMSLPAILSINGNQEIQFVEKSLSLRSQRILKKGKWAPKPYVKEEPRHSPGFINPATYCPLPFAPCENSDEEEQPQMPFDIRTADIQSGEDLAAGIIAVDGARVLLNRVRHEAKDIKQNLYLDLRDALLELVDDNRAFLKRRLQYFINMLLFPMGFRNEKVKVFFDGYWMEPREFTVNVKPKERRGATLKSEYFLLSIMEATKEINDTLVKVLDLSIALSELKVADEDYEELMPCFKEVLDALSLVKDDGSMAQRHRFQCLRATLREVTNRLKEPDILTFLKAENEKNKFMQTVDLMALAKWRAMKQKELSTTKPLVSMSENKLVYECIARIEQCGCSKCSIERLKTHERTKHDIMFPVGGTKKCKQLDCWICMKYKQLQALQGVACDGPFHSSSR